MAMNSSGTGLGTEQLSNTLVAVFATDHDARDAIKQLHKAGFKQTWLGKTKPANGTTGVPAVEDANFSLGRFFNDQESLHRALVRRGVAEDQAAEVEQDIAPGCLVLTVYAEDNPQGVADLILAGKGQVFGEATLPSAVSIASMNPRTGVDKDDKKRVDKDTDRASEAARGVHEHPPSAHGDDDDYPADEFVEYRGEGVRGDNVRGDLTTQR